MSSPVMIITGTRKGIGRFLAEYYVEQGYHVFGCSRSPSDFQHPNYHHSCLDVVDEPAVKALFSTIRKTHKQLDVLINNAGIASMNHATLTPMDTVRRVLDTNVAGTFLFSREASKLMKKNSYGRIINFSTVAVPLKLEGECIYAASKAAVVSMTQVMAREFAQWNITVNAVGPTPVETDLIRNVPEDKLNHLCSLQAIPRLGEKHEVLEVVQFFMKPENRFVTGQVVYLGGV